MSHTSTAFERAFTLYEQQQLSEDERKFLALCRDSPSKTHDEISHILEDKEKRMNRGVKRQFQRIALALHQYSSAISEFVSAYPMPLALVWGALRIVVDSADRCEKLFETMRDEFDKLEKMIQLLSDIDELYCDAEKTQELVVDSYMNILRFWNRVHKECVRGSSKTFARSLTTDSTKKLQAILSQLQSVMDALELQSRFDEVRRQRLEYQKAQDERDAAALERAQQSQFRDRQHAENYLELSDKIRNFLRPQSLADANDSRHEGNLMDRHIGTCSWIQQDGAYLSWKEKASNPIICVTGPVGFGKTVLTSTVIQEMKETHAVAYYFCQRSQPCDSALKLLRLFALQLFNTYFLRQYPVDDKLAHQVFNSHDVQHLKVLLEQFIRELQPVYFFVDALDELKEDLKSVSFVLSFLLEQTANGARIWCTHRSHTRHSECYEMLLKLPHSHISIQGRTTSDVQLFLQQHFRELRKRLLENEQMDKTEELVLDMAELVALKTADGSFLWAALVARSLCGPNRPTTVQEVAARLMDPHDSESNELYKLYESIFQQIQESDRKYASEVISLVAFSERDLRVDELREAVGFVSLRGKKKRPNNENDRLSFSTYLSRFTVLVQVTRTGDQAEGDGYCRLVHSSVRDFLETHPNVLSSKTANSERPAASQISPKVIANACLNYLSQPAFSQLLKKQIVEQNGNDFIWVDSLGEPMDNRYFAPYAAKYWTTHFEAIEPDENQRQRVVSFINSANFATCIQLQVLWVEGRFHSYTVGNIRVIPRWLIGQQDPSAGDEVATNTKKRRSISPLWIDHLFLLHDWQALLTCFFCDNRSCRFAPYIGEVDRIWWPSIHLGSTFMAKFPSRYNSFNLATELTQLRSAQSGNNRVTEDMVSGWRHEAICVVGGGVKVLRLVHRDHATHKRNLTFVVDHWGMGGKRANVELISSQTIMTDEHATNWQSYVSRKAPPRDTISVVARATQFAPNGLFLRIGAQIFALDHSGQYELLSSSMTKGLQYLEDFAAHGKVVAFGTRESHRLQANLNKDELEVSGGDLAYLERAAGGKNVCQFDDDDWTDVSGSESEEDDDDAAVESYSEDSDSDMLPEDSDVSSESEDDEGVEESVQESAEEASSNASSTSDQDKDELESSASSSSARSPSPIYEMYASDSDDEEDRWALQVDQQLQRKSARTQGKKQEKCTTFSIVDVAQNPPTRLFEYRRPSSTMMYASPPAIHPNEQLCVFPLDLGDILFANFADNTFFLRKIRPTSSKARQISVQPRFSSCAGFLHLAVIEAGIPPANHSRKSSSSATSKSESPSWMITAVIFTYKLSKSKPTRAPPSLAHTAKVRMGVYDSDALKNSLPVTFTWAENGKEVYVMRRGIELLVYKVALFAEDGESVRVLRDKVFLPVSVLAREAHFQADSEGTGFVFLGSQDVVASRDRHPSPPLHASLKGMLPPMGCILGHEDMGGWVNADEVTVRMGKAIGKLDLRREKFDPVDDCHVEQYGL